MRFHPTYASMSVGESAGGLPPDDAVRDEDDILAESQRAVERHHDCSHGDGPGCARPCSPFSVGDLAIRSAELAERLDVRLHTHLAENSEDDEYAIALRHALRRLLRHCGWMSTAVGVLTSSCRTRTKSPGSALPASDRPCPSSNMILRRASPQSSISTPVSRRPRLRRILVGRLRLAVAGSPPRHAAGQAERRDAMDARTALEISTRGGAGCLGRIGEIGELSVGASATLPSGNSMARSSQACSTTSSRAGCEPAPLGLAHGCRRSSGVESGLLVAPDLDEKLTHAAAARRFQPTGPSVSSASRRVRRAAGREALGFPREDYRRPPVKTERHGGVLVVQLDRDEKRNAINGEMTESISAARRRRG